ncbi:MAG: divergent polysaccharide deacetylase family protein [Candidatus Omnitrophota bacterium]|jgi:polysaccharide deacetylase 2 family uncharacterized protein YibQ
MIKRAFVIIIAIVLVFALVKLRTRDIEEREAPDRIKTSSEKEKNPVAALVLDDFGYTRRNLGTLIGLDTPVTIAVLPNVPYSKTVSSFADKNGVQVILHLPMEPEGGSVRLERETIMTGMDKEMVENIIAQAFESVPAAKGVSNHQGSRATKNEKIMEIVMDQVDKRGLFFLDSMTTDGSVCGKAAGEKGVLFAKRDIFIDEKNDEDYIIGQMKKVEELARRKGYVIAIGHERPKTLKVLREVMPEMKERGIKFVTLSEIIELEEDDNTRD